MSKGPTEAPCWPGCGADNLPKRGYVQKAGQEHQWLLQEGFGAVNAARLNESAYFCPVSRCTEGCLNPCLHWTVNRCLGNWGLGMQRRWSRLWCCYSGWIIPYFVSNPTSFGTINQTILKEGEKKAQIKQSTECSPVDETCSYWNASDSLFWRCRKDKVGF